MAKTLAEIQAAAQVRWARVVRLRGEGRTLQEIADLLGITRERVRQIEARGQRHLGEQARKDEKK